MNDTQMTIAGNVVDTPKLRRTKNGHFVANFRVASTPRHFDREKGSWVDDQTLFVSVSCWRAMAENVAESLQKGQPVLVSGRYRQREYEQNEILHTSYELEAFVVGHDLSRGVAKFTRVRREAIAHIDLDEEGIPTDASEHYLDLVEDRAAAEIDLGTGEMRELVTAG